jgi:hypothetical protein
MLPQKNYEISLMCYMDEPSTYSIYVCNFVNISRRRWSPHQMTFQVLVNSAKASGLSVKNQETSAQLQRVSVKLQLIFEPVRTLPLWEV